jgi:inner membrane protein
MAVFFTAIFGWRKRTIDTFTQIALGAAVGEATLGRKIGNKAMLWGGICGTIPDLDVLANPFLDGVTQLGFHRGFSHSLVFAILIAPLLGVLLSRLYRNLQVGWQSWGWLAFWAVITHPLLDLFTNYGTQLFLPFSNYPAALSSIFIIDPVYTLILTGAVLWARRLKADSPKRQKIIIYALLLSTAYLFTGLSIKLVVESRIRNSLEQREITFDRIYSNPAPLTIFLWQIIVDDGEGQWVTTYSVFDGDEISPFQYVPKNRQLIEPYLNQPAIQKLMWFSRGYYHVKKVDNRLIFCDLRFGRSDFFLSDSGDYVFQFQLIQSPEMPEKIVDISRMRPQIEISGKKIAILFQRVVGIKPTGLSTARPVEGSDLNTN